MLSAPKIELTIVGSYRCVGVEKGWKFGAVVQNNEFTRAERRKDDDDGGFWKGMWDWNDQRKEEESQPRSITSLSWVSRKRRRFIQKLLKTAAIKEFLSFFELYSFNHSRLIMTEKYSWRRTPSYSSCDGRNQWQKESKRRLISLMNQKNSSLGLG